jgi:hypothetical protein
VSTQYNSPGQKAQDVIVTKRKASNLGYNEQHCLIRNRRVAFNRLGLFIGARTNMNLNLHIFADELVSYTVKTYIKPTIDLNLSKLEIYQDQTYFSEDTLYLIEAPLFLPDLAKKGGVNWLCFGEIDASLLELLQGNLLVLPQTQLSYEFILELYSIQSKYTSWSEKLLTALASRDAVKILFKSIVGTIFSNPILILNPIDLYAISCGSLPDDFDNQEWMSLVNHEPFDVDIKKEIIDNSKRSPFISKETENYSFLTTNVYVDNVRTGKVIHCNANQPFTLGYISLAAYLNTIMELFAKRALYNTEIGDRETDLFIELLESWHADEEWLKHQLDALDWQPSCRSYLIVGSIREISNSNEHIDILRVVLRKLKNLYPLSQTFLYKDTVVSVLDPENYPYDKTTIQNRLEHVFSNSGVSFGVSKIFYDIRHLKSFYKQSLYLVKNTSQENKEIVQFYDTVFFRHFTENYGINSDYHWLVHPKISLLESYDREANTSYIKCLGTYIECCCNKKAASEHLFIHYNTLVYRLERIKEIADIDFNDIHKLSDELFHILLSCKLITEGSVD